VTRNALERQVGYAKLESILLNNSRDLLVLKAGKVGSGSSKFGEGSWVLSKRFEYLS